MKRLCVMLGLAFAASAATAQAQDQSIVHWQDIVGVITAQGVNNPVSDHINSGTFAWTTSGGNASVNLASGKTSFDVQGLVINGTQFSGTPGPITDVMGTLVCNAVDATQNTPGSSKIANTRSVPLNAQGDAEFSGTIQNIPAPCNNPLFLVRVATQATGAVGRWIATGTERTIGD